MTQQPIGSADTERETLPLRTFIVPPGFGAQAGRTLFVFFWSRPRNVIVMGGFAVFIVAAAVFIAVTTNGAVIPAAAVVLFGFVWVGLMYIFGQRRTTAGIAAQLPAGTELTLQLKSDRLHVSSPTTTADIGYSTYSSVWQRDSVVIVKLRQVNMYVVYPLALFAPGDVEIFSERVIAAN